MATEETKPMEREAAVALSMAYNAGWGAALEKAAEVVENAMLTPKQKLALRGQPDDPDEILFGIAGAIRALKGME